MTVIVIVIVDERVEGVGIGCLRRHIIIGASGYVAILDNR